MSSPTAHCRPDCQHCEAMDRFHGLAQALDAKGYEVEANAMLRVALLAGAKTPFGQLLVASLLDPAT